MRARLVVFPIKGRNWCFAKALDSISSSQSSSSPPKLKDLWRKINADGASTKQNMEAVADFVADKMNRGWVALEKAPQGSIKSKIHSFGVKLLSRVKPTENLLKSVSEDVTKVEITYPASLNPRLVRRRLRHMAIRGCAIHKKNFYGSVTLLPLTSAFSVLPLPNIPFFWILFRAYSNWRAFKGSERLLLLVSDCSKSWSSLVHNGKDNDSKDDLKLDSQSPWEVVPESSALNVLKRDCTVREEEREMRTVRVINRAIKRASHEVWFIRFCNLQKTLRDFLLVRMGMMV